MRIDWWTLALQTINVLVLVWLLQRFLFRPVADIIAARQAEAKRLLDDAGAAKTEAEAQRRRASDETQRLAGARGEALAAAARDAEAEKAAILSAAKAEAERQRAAAQGEIERARRNESVAAENCASRLAVDIASKLLDRLPAAARALGFLDGVLSGLAALSAAEHEAIRAGAPLRLRSATPLDAAELDEIRARLAETLGGPVAVAPEVDASLIAGFEIDAPHAIVRNNLRADLDRIVAELTSHDDARA